MNNKNEPRKEIFYSYLDAIKKSNDPQLFYHHDDLPHYPYEYLPSGKMYTRMSSDPGMSNEVWGNNQWIVIQNYQRHLLQVQFVDKMLGDFLSKIKSQGLFDQSMIVVLSDHGASFYTNDNRRSITGSNVQNIASVPFFIKKPYQQNGYIDEVSAETIDILPTILDVIGASSSHDFDGNSLFVDLPEVRKKAIYSQDATSIISLDEKIMKDKQRFFLKSKYTNKDEFSTDNEKIFKLGDYSEIINSDLNNFSIVQSNKYSISINSEFSFSSVDLNSSFIPADISGYIYESNENSDEEIDLAIAVNGKIRAITRTIQGVAWNSVVNENSFINGNNEIEIFRIINNDFSVTLDKLNHLLNDDYSIIIEDDQSFLMNNTSSNRFIFKTSALAGRVDVVKFDGINLEIRGWAADPLTKDRPKNILLFADNVLIGNVKPYLSRPDVAEYLINPQYTNSGYLLSYKFKEENINQPTYRVLVLCENGDVFEISR